MVKQSGDRNKKLDAPDYNFTHSEEYSVTHYSSEWHSPLYKVSLIKFRDFNLKLYCLDQFWRLKVWRINRKFPIWITKNQTFDPPPLSHKVHFLWTYLTPVPTLMKANPLRDRETLVSQKKKKVLINMTLSPRRIVTLQLSLILPFFHIFLQFDVSSQRIAPPLLDAAGLMTKELVVRVSVCRLQATVLD